jgi:hypothetical protein
MSTSTRNATRPAVVTGKAAKTGRSPSALLTTKLRKKWQFAPDAIGMIGGPRDLSRRKGLSA